MASAVTLSGFAGGEHLPLPASEGRAFPFLLTLDGSPLLQQISLRKIGFHKKWGNPGCSIIDSLPSLAL